jgi:thioredoxin reductase
MKIERATIIGAGPAGIATAIQVKRYGIEPILLEKSHVGGLLVNANLVENYPGFPQGISGIELVRLFEAQLEKAGVQVHFAEALRLSYDETFVIATQKSTFRSQIAVVASGTKPKEFEIPKEAADRIFYEVYPIAAVESERIAVVGAGDAAFDYALNLGGKNEVIILNRGQRKRCLPLLWERVKNSPQITYQENAEISGIERANNRLILECNTPEGKQKFQANYVIFAIGRVRQIDYLSESLRERTSELEEQGLLYFVGDVKNDPYRQTAIAIGDGVHTAMKIYEKLMEVSL